MFHSLYTLSLVGLCGSPPVSAGAAASLNCLFFLSVGCCRASNTAFKEALKHIEMTTDCGGLPMISFLILPMQRATRLPLLMDVSAHFLFHLLYQRGGPVFMLLYNSTVLGIGFSLTMTCKACKLHYYSCYLFIFFQTICQKTSTHLEEYHSAVKALKSISKVMKINQNQIRGAHTLHHRAIVFL